MTMPLLSAVCLQSALIAYVGPGAGLSMLGALIGLLLTLAVAGWAVASWPLRVMMRARRERLARASAAERIEE